MANLVLVTGSSDLSNTASYDTASLPADGDSVYYRNSTTNITAGLNQSAIEPALVEVELSMSGLFPATGTFEMGPAILNIGRLNGIQTISQAGSARIVWDNSSDICALTVFNTATTSTNTGYEPFRWKGTNASNTLTIYGGTAGIATNDPDDTATLATVYQFGGTLNLAAGCTLTTLNIDGSASVMTFRSAATTLNQANGTVSRYGSGALTTWAMKGGRGYDYSTGTITTATVLEGAALYKWSAAATITTTNLYDQIICDEKSNVRHSLHFAIER